MARCAARRPAICRTTMVGTSTHAHCDADGYLVGGRMGSAAPTKAEEEEADEVELEEAAAADDDAEDVADELLDEDEAAPNVVVFVLHEKLALGEIEDASGHGFVVKVLEGQEQSRQLHSHAGQQLLMLRLHVARFVGQPQTRLRRQMLLMCQRWRGCSVRKWLLG